MHYKKHKIVLLILMLIFCPTSSIAGGKINPGKYILVSFSMNDQALKDYFIEAQKHGAVLVFRGLISDGKGGSFALTGEKFESLKINGDINPLIFDELAIRHVPVIVVVGKDGRIKKLSGHVPLLTALRKMGEV